MDDPISSSLSSSSLSSSTPALAAPSTPPPSIPTSAPILSPSPVPSSSSSPAQRARDRPRLPAGPRARKAFPKDDSYTIGLTHTQSKTYVHGPSSHTQSQSHFQSSSPSFALEAENEYVRSRSASPHRSLRIGSSTHEFLPPYASRASAGADHPTGSARSSSPLPSSAQDPPPSPPTTSDPSRLSTSTPIRPHASPRISTSTASTSFTSTSTSTASTSHSPQFQRSPADPTHSSLSLPHSPSWITNKPPSTPPLTRTQTSLSTSTMASSITPLAPSPILRNPPSPSTSSNLAPSFMMPTLASTRTDTSTPPAPIPVPKQTLLPPSHPMTFAPPSLPSPTYRPLPFSAAQWTFSSTELQSLVSAAIRDSAREHAIRLLQPAVVAPGGALEQDLERANGERAGAQARWRFEAGRRRMLLQSLNAVAQAQAGATVGNGSTMSVNGGGDAGSSALQALAVQLAQAATALDVQTEALIHAGARSAQLVHLRDAHRASALAVALRKLNGSYERRGRELAGVRARVEQLEAEVEEAWRVAEDVAKAVDREAKEKAEAEAETRERVEVGVQVEPDVESDSGEEKEEMRREGERMMVDVEVQVGVEECGHNAGDVNSAEIARNAQNQKEEDHEEENAPTVSTIPSLDNVGADEAPCALSDSVADPIATPTATSYTDSITRGDRGGADEDEDEDKNEDENDNEDDNWEETTTIDGASTVISDMTSIRNVEVIGVTGTAVVSKARLTMVGPNRDEDRDEVAQERIARAAQRRSTASQVSRVSAARKRSMRASKASLRLPSSSTTSSAMTAGTATTSGSVATVAANSKTSVRAIRGRSRSRGRSASPNRSGRVSVPPLPVMIGAGTSTRGAGVQRRSLAVAGMDLAVSQARRGADAEEDEDDGTMSFLEMERQESGEEQEAEQGRERTQKRESGRGAPRETNVEAETRSDRASRPSFEKVHPYSASFAYTPASIPNARPRPTSPTSPRLLASYTPNSAPATSSTSRQRPSPPATSTYSRPRSPRSTPAFALSFSTPALHSLASPLASARAQAQALRKGKGKAGSDSFVPLQTPPGPWTLSEAHSRSGGGRVSGDASRSASALEFGELRGSGSMSPSLSASASGHSHGTGSAHAHGHGIGLSIGGSWGRRGKSLEFASSTSSASSTPVSAFSPLSTRARAGAGSSVVDSEANTGQDARPGSSAGLGGSVGRSGGKATALKRSMSELLSIRLGRGRRRSVPMRFAERDGDVLSEGDGEEE